MSRSKEQHCKFLYSRECDNYKAVRDSGRPRFNPSVKCRVPKERRGKCAVPTIVRQMGIEVKVEEDR